MFGNRKMKRRKRSTYILLIIIPMLVTLNTSCANNVASNNSPEQVVDEYIKAYIGGDLDGVLETMNPQDVQKLEATYGENYRDEISQELELPPMAQIQPYGMVYTNKIAGGLAYVTVTEGKMKYLGTDGNWVFPQSGFPYNYAVFQTEKINGVWYLDNVLKVGEMSFDLSTALDGGQLQEIYSFLKSLDGVDENSIAFQDQHQMYEQSIKNRPEMESVFNENDFPAGGMIQWTVDEPADVLPVKDKILTEMPYHEDIKNLRTFYVSAGRP